jgi:hypothetical protein
MISRPFSTVQLILVPRLVSVGEKWPAW